MSRVFTMPVASVYPHYVNKVEKKGRTQAELDEVIEWLTGYDDAQLQARLADGTTFEEFFAGARLNPNSSLITGLSAVPAKTSRIRSCRRSATSTSWSTSWAKGKPMAKVLRTQ